jgi:uncharacterized membrane protein
MGFPSGYTESALQKDTDSATHENMRQVDFHSITPDMFQPENVQTGQNLPERARLAGGAAMAFAFLWLTLEVRRSFHGAAGMAGPGYLQLEAWAYTAVWIAFALALLGLGLMRKRPALRYASLAVLMGAVVKAFVFDMGALEGGLRALSFLGLGVTIIGVALFYQRVIFPVAGKINAPALDPNPTPTPPPAQSG